MIDKDTIPSFGIEDINQDAPNVNSLGDDLLFVDDIRQLPSRDAMKVKMNLLLISLRGKLSVALNGHRVEVSERQMLMSRSNVIADEYMVSPNYEGKMMMVSDRLAKLLLGQHIDIWQREFYVRPYILIDLDERDFTEYSLFYQLLSLKSQNVGTLLQKEVILALLQAALLDICRKFHSQDRCKITENQPQPSESSVLNQGSLLFHRFLSLLSHAAVKRRSVAYYAEQLCVSPKYLSTVCQKESGKSPHEWIREYTMVDIAYYLKSTTLTVKEIANRLEFPNLSFFGRYVKEHLGMSPTQFRENLHSS